MSLYLSCTTWWTSLQYQCPGIPLERFWRTKIRQRHRHFINTCLERAICAVSLVLNSRGDRGKNFNNIVIGRHMKLIWNAAPWCVITFNPFNDEQGRETKSFKESYFIFSSCYKSTNYILFAVKLKKSRVVIFIFNWWIYSFLEQTDLEYWE